MSYTIGVAERPKAASERVVSDGQASLRDAFVLFPFPWTEVHGYHQPSLRDGIGYREAG